MDDRQFFDTLIQLWVKTTNASNSFWGYKSDYEMFDLYAQNQDEEQTFLGYFDSEADADFVTALHGCFPDLVRRLHEALDEADRLDYEMDSVQNKLMEAELRLMELKEELNG